MSSQINTLETVLASQKTVFTLQSLMMLTGCSDTKKLTKSLHYYAKGGKLLNPRKGVYAKLKYDEQEMACSLFRPSYISLEYVLSRAGVVFQWDDTITSVSYLSREVEVDGKSYHFRKINPEVWVGKALNNAAMWRWQRLRKLFSTSCILAPETAISTI